MPKLFHSADNSRYLYKCPGCGNFHTYYVGKPNVYGSMWKFNGDVNSPYFDSTLMIRGVWETGEDFVCHSMLRHGRVTFLSDTTHSYRNRTVELEDILYS